MGTHTVKVNVMKDDESMPSLVVNKTYVAKWKCPLCGRDVEVPFESRDQCDLALMKRARNGEEPIPCLHCLFGCDRRWSVHEPGSPGEYYWCEYQPPKIDILVSINDEGSKMVPLSEGRAIVSADAQGER